MPKSVSSERGGLRKYLEIISTPLNERPKAFSNLSNTDRATVLRIHLASQFERRPGMSEQQKDVILETISSVAAENYNTDNPDREAKARILSQSFQARVANLFSRRDSYEIFSSLSGNPTELGFLQRYNAMLENEGFASRKQRFIRGSEDERSGLMRAQMVYYLATASLALDQQRFFVKMIDAAVPAAFGLPADDLAPTRKETLILFNLKEEAQKLFSKDEMFAFFMSLGIHDIDRAREARDSILPENQQTCLCNWYCAPCYECVVLNHNCNATKVGCGWDLLEACTSPCRWNWADCFPF
jgi:hypothetical protein